MADWDAAFWDARYRSLDAVWSGAPNAQLVAEASALRPGVALDVGCGEGADAIWLAQHGWTVVAVDFSGYALERAGKRADKAGDDVADRILWRLADVTAEDDPRLPQADLVSAQFLHVPGDQWRRVLSRLIDAVAPGGTLLLVGHDPSDLHSTVSRPKDEDVYWSPVDVAAMLDEEQWVVEAAESRERFQRTDPVDHQHGHHHGDVVRDAVLRARRRGPAPHQSAE
ncbi:SAM-dependent methyltransferase [Herbiconiux sp. SYSU D00978]|uniref:SAM-dependent methyltransferase n=1 Tax=Herbiconiux sp. SYSU D00978 TaxID=2812562 RepID=UPI0027DB4444|nr:class I SAM-dependent methyltransferase [Herbiconiux sp. SYSU D00978]